jgi:prepilin-type N-terminal cleavage/methylation domain-containing protein
MSWKGGDRMKKQSGFTLIELAIVLVIIGWLLGGVLKGQELINSAKVKNMATDFKNVQVYIYGYQDKFKALPGDDGQVATHLKGATVATTGTVSNGVIQGDWDSETGTDESVLFWQHVRLANLASGPTTVDANFYPKNADGGRFGVQSISGFTSVSNMSGTYVACSRGILGKFAKQLDVSLDDGDGSKGSVRVVVKASISDGIAAAVDSSTYDVCMSF